LYFQPRDALFKRVYDEAKKAGDRQPLEEYYHLPNLGRRLLEAFFAFRFPQERGDLYKQLERSKCDAATGARLVRFLDTYSHNQTVGETGQDLSILAETPQILKDLMELIKAQDPSHFSEMEKLLAETSSA
jgi:wobble nucleotide-excising tRNase